MVNAEFTVNGETLRVRDERRISGRKNGAQGRDRTTDTVIFSHVLYQLSYLGSRDRAGRPSKRRAP